MAMSMVLIGVAMIVNEMGLGSALVQKPELSEEEIKTLKGTQSSWEQDLNMILQKISTVEPKKMTQKQEDLVPA